MLNRSGVVPLNVYYEDLCVHPAGELERIMNYLELPLRATPDTKYVPQADDISEEWVQRLRRELQHGWENVGW